MSRKKGDKDKNPRKKSVVARVGNLDTGLSSELVKRLSGCAYCPIRDLCEKKDNLTDPEYMVGCQDVREYHLIYLKAYGRPEAIIIATMAEIETKLRLQEIIDGKQQKAISPQYLALLRMKKDWLDMILKYGKGTKNVTEVIVRRGQDINVNPEAYAIHTNSGRTEEGSSGDLPADKQDISQ